jgi:hypothetical protein
LRWRWLVVALIAVSVAATELIERQPNNLEFWHETLVYGGALPLLGGATLSIMVGAVSGPTPTPTRLTLDKQRVFVVESELLLGAGVASLLSRESDLQVIGIMPDDEAALVEQIKRCEPDVVVLNEATYLIEATTLLALLPDYPELRVLVLSASDDKVQVFDKHQIMVTDAVGLAKLIKGQYPAGKEDS